MTVLMTLLTLTLISSFGTAITKGKTPGVDIWMGDHLDKIPGAVLLGKSGWRSGHQSRLPPLLLLYVD